MNLCTQISLFCGGVPFIINCMVNLFLSPEIESRATPCSSLVSRSLHYKIPLEGRLSFNDSGSLARDRVTLPHSRNCVAVQTLKLKRCIISSITAAIVQRGRVYEFRWIHVRRPKRRRQALSARPAPEGSVDPRRDLSLKRRCLPK